MYRRISLVVMTMLFAGVVSGTARAQDAAAAKPVTIDVFGDGELKVPSQFTRVAPKSSIIAHEFQAKVGEGKDGQTARVTMMAAGGDVTANIDRWKGQFAGGDKDKQKTEVMKIGNWEVYVVDVNGNYAERMGGGPFAGGKVVNREDYAMTGAILVHPEGRKYFVKMIGPAEVVQSNREAFVKMIKGLGK